MPRLARLLRPYYIATLGGAMAEAVIAQCDRMGFAGRIWPLHPKRSSMGGRRCYANVGALPQPPDAVFVGINRHATIDAVRELAAANAGGAVCYASGYAETGAQGRALQDALCAAAGVMPILGPNCYGFVNYLDGALLWPDAHGGRRVERGVALITQSSNIAINLTMQRRALPIAYVLTLGNRANVGLAQAVDAAAADTRVTAIGLHIEGIGDPAAFAHAVENARSRGICLVVVKAGRTAAGAALALSHTASLAGADAVVDALFERLGVARVHTLPALLEALKLLHAGGPLAGANVVSLSCSGGEAALMSDAGESRVCFGAFSARDQQRIRPTVNSLVTISNPFDYHTFDWYRPQRLGATFEAVMRSHHDLVMLVLDYPLAHVDSTHWDGVADAFVDAAKQTLQRCAVLATLPECMPEARALALLRRGVTPLLGIDDALEATAAAALLGSFKPEAPLRSQPALSAGAAMTLTECEAKQALAAYGLVVPQGALCHTEDEAVSVFKAVGNRVAMKAVGRAIAHKTELGAVALEIDSESQARQHFGRLAEMADGVLVESMVGNVVAELIVGVVRDPVVGLHLVVGAGGVLAEALEDTRVLLLPTSKEAVLHAFHRLRLAPLLLGWRGRVKADLESAADAVLAVERYALAHLDVLQELDVNPLLVCAEGAIAVDALIVLRGER